MIIQYTHYPHKTQFFTHFSKKKRNWLFQKVTNDTSFRYFHVWEKFGFKWVNDIFEECGKNEYISGLIKEALVDM